MTGITPELHSTNAWALGGVRKGSNMMAIASNVRDIGSKIGGEVSAKSVGDAGVGALVYLLATPGGDISLDALRSALDAVGSGAMPPESPSVVCRTARAAATVAAKREYSCVSCRKVEGAKRGTQGWEIVRGAYVDPTEGTTNMGARVSPIVATARAGYFEGEPGIVDELRDAFRAAEDLLTNEDMAGWFSEKVDKLGGIAIKGGVYYLPAHAASRFERFASAIERAAGDKFQVHMAPLASAEASMRIVLSALVEDTTKAVDEIAMSIEAGVGKRALEARETKCRFLLDRLDTYAAILGPKLDAIRGKVTEAQGAVAVAFLAANEDEAPAAKG